MNAQSAKGLIDYSEKAIVSKQLLKKPNGNVTLFAFDTNEQLSEHTSPFDALVMIVDGIMEIGIGDEKVIAEEGEIVNLPANIPHSLLAVQPSKMILIMIK